MTLLSICALASHSRWKFPRGHMFICRWWTIANMQWCLIYAYVCTDNLLYLAVIASLAIIAIHPDKPATTPLFKRCINPLQSGLSIREQTGMNRELLPHICQSSLYKARLRTGVEHWKDRSIRRRLDRIADSKGTSAFEGKPKEGCARETV